MTKFRMQSIAIAALGLPVGYMAGVVDPGFMKFGLTLLATCMILGGLWGLGASSKL